VLNFAPASSSEPARPRRCGPGRAGLSPRRLARL